LSTAQKVIDQLREMTGQSIVMGEAIARQVGLRPADLEVLGAIQQHGPLTAGRLGLLTGLSAAAVTGLIDRLERAGVAARQPDPADRRRVLVAASPGAARVSEHYTRIEQDALRVLGRRSPEELAVIEDFLRDMYEIGVQHVVRLDPGRA
jgi:DNA-binding MarR family transcriptional regulator